jgi:hypothetical protein
LEGSYLLRAVNAVETDAFCMVVVQDFEGVTVENGNDGAGEIYRDSGVGEKDIEECSPNCEHGATC